MIEQFVSMVSQEVFHGVVAACMTA
jgi:hypothetical protein